MSYLQQLPVELLHLILPLLDAIGLVSLGQTCTRLRQVIHPGRQHFVERLLALECIPEFGGGAPHLSVRDQRLEPPFSEAGWRDYRWACTGCLRLRSHVHFDNRSLFRLGSRKPVDSSAGAEARTTWSPSLHGKSWGRRARQPLSQEERVLRQRYRVSIHQYEVFDPPYLWRWVTRNLRSIGIEGFDDVDDAQFDAMTQEDKDVIFDRNIRAIEVLRSGSKRHVRRCNECKYQSGQLRGRVGSSHGTPTTPIQASRLVRLTSANERYFPGLSDYLGVKRPPFDLPIGELCTVNDVFTIELEGSYSRLWTMYMLRCSRCERWQEMRFFRLGDYAPWWAPKIGTDLWDGEALSVQLLDTIRCNRCFAEEKGTLALGQVISDFVHSLVVEYDRYRLEGLLCWGWFALEQILAKIPLPYRKKLRHHLKRVHDRQMMSWQGREFTHLDIAFLKLHHAECVELWEAMDTVEIYALERLRNSFWFQNWLHKFHEFEAFWYWINSYTAAVRENHDLVARWALSRDSFTSLATRADA